MLPTASRSDPGVPARTGGAAPGGLSRIVRLLRSIRRMAFLVHRWLGIGIALLMAMWALSGLVMMYVSFPETSATERLAGLEPLRQWTCCTGDLPDDQAIETASVEMLDGRPVVRWQGVTGEGAVDATTGAKSTIDAEAARRIAWDHYRRSTGPGLAPEVEQIERDQWTVYGRFRQHRPLWKASFADDAGTVLYVSSSEGRVVQDTTRHERFWNWLGAVPHWLYFTAFRQNQPLWYNFVVYASVLGVFLTVTGIYVGLRQYGRGRRRSPYRGLALWHHWTGLIFGVFTLTWMVSGLFSMQPWGMFESKGAGAEVAAMRGRPMNTDDLRRFLAGISVHPGEGVVSARLTVQDSEAWAILTYRDGREVRAELPRLAESPLSTADLTARAQTMRPGTPIIEMGMITQPDAYYYAHKGEATLPAYRIIYGDAERTRIYLNPRTGEVAGYADSVSRSYRWWFNGLHRMDFAGWLRQRPVWDAVTLPLMLGVSLLTLAGFALGLRRLRKMARGKPRAISER